MLIQHKCSSENWWIRYNDSIKKGKLLGMTVRRKKQIKS